MSELSARTKIPYPSRTDDPFYAAFVAMVNALDVQHYASREDRNLLLTGGGLFSFVVVGPTGTLSFTSDLDILSANTGFLESIEPTSIDLADGEFFYVNLVRAPLTGVVLGVGIATTIPSTQPNDSFVLGVRKGPRVIFRTGAVLNDGDSIAIFETGATISLSGALPSTVQAGAAGSAGVGTTASKGDHSHPVSTALAIDLAAVDAAAASAGVSTKLPRGDHKHQISIGSPSSQVVGAGAVGVAVSVPRSDHVHPMASGAPSTATGITNVEGVSTDVARRDHVHRIEVEGLEGGVAKGARPRLNFVGATVVDNAGADRLDVFTAAAPTVSTYACPGTVAVRDIVYVSAASTVDKADASGIATMPVLGIVLSKPTAITAVVQLGNGEVVGYGGLTPGAVYYADPTIPGGITATAPVAVGEVVQKIGIATSAAVLAMQLGDHTIL